MREACGVRQLAGAIVRAAGFSKTGASSVLHTLCAVETFPSRAVLDSAAVGFGLSNFDFLTGQQALHRFAHVIARCARVAFRHWPIINRAFVSQVALLIYYKHMRCRAHPVFFSDLAIAIVEPCRSCYFLSGPFLLCGFG